MNALFQFTTEAIEDLDNIWYFIAQESPQAADRVEAEVIATCRRIAEYPRIGHKRQDITPLPVRFWTLLKYPNYVIVYRPDTLPLQVIAVLHGKRDLEEVLER